ncbi:hypothetical protein ACFLX4_02890 [Chloroflexota bacterium]
MNDEVENIIGLFINLGSSEQLSFETKEITPVLFIKEMESRSLGKYRRQEVPISLCQAQLYLTNERLLILVLYQTEVDLLFQPRMTRVPRPSSIPGVWFEIPLSAIRQVEDRRLKPVQSQEMRKFFEFVFPNKKELVNFLDSSAVELIYDEQSAMGKYRDYIKSSLKTEALTRRLAKKNIVFDKLIVIGDEISFAISSLKVTLAKSRLRPPSRLSKNGDD